MEASSYLIDIYQEDLGLKKIKNKTITKKKILSFRQVRKTNTCGKRIATERSISECS